MSVKAKNLIDEDDPRVSQIGHPAPAWLVNYADLMTELVCFFVILYALTAALNKKVIAAKQEIDRMIQKDNLKAEVKITKEGMYITLEEQGQNVLFESGKADLSPAMVDVLSKVGPTLKKLSDTNEILIEGHTDNVPASHPYESNWELSTARATNVVRYMVKSQGFNPKHTSAIGYGEYRPIAPNDTPENKSKNRRVVFFVKNTPPPDLAKPPPKAP